MIKADFVDEIGVSFAVYGDEIYHHKPVFWHVFESHARPGNIKDCANILGAEPDFAVLIGGRADIQIGKLEWVGQDFELMLQSHLPDQGWLRQNRAQNANIALATDLRQADLDSMACSALRTAVRLIVCSLRVFFVINKTTTELRNRMAGWLGFAVPPQRAARPKAAQASPP